MSGCIDTASGRRFSYIGGGPEEVCIEDIATALSRCPRFGGHTIEFFSVAQHCFEVSLLVRDRGGNEREQLVGLLHDATEAYMCDLPKPLKRLLPDYSNYEHGVWRKIGVALFGEPVEISPLVKECDVAMLLYERETLFSKPMDESWDHWRENAVPVPRRWVLVPHGQQVARMEFLERYEDLSECLAALSK